MVCARVAAVVARVLSVPLSTILNNQGASPNRIDICALKAEAPRRDDFSRFRMSCSQLDLRVIGADELKQHIKMNDCW
jgi:hypothetical protein